MGATARAPFLGGVTFNTGELLPDCEEHSSLTTISPELHFQQRGPQNHVAKAALLTTLVLDNLYFTLRRALRLHLAGL